QDASAKKKTVSSQSLNQKTAVRAMQVVAMFSFMAIFWTLWSSPTLSDWWNLVLKAFQAPFGEWMQLALRMCGLVLAAFIGFRIFEIPQVKAFMEPDEGKSLSVFWGGLTLSFFALLTIPSVLTVFQTCVNKPIEHIYESRLTEEDDAQMVNGYYEDLLITNQLTSPLAETQRRPEDWTSFGFSDAAISTNDWLKYDFRPSTKSIFKGVELSTNEWGMRDKFYPKEKPEGHFRIGIMGGSYVMGSGVGDNDVFDVVCENALNKPSSQEIIFDLLNFGVPGYHLLHSTHRFITKATDFDLDAVMVFTHGLDFRKSKAIVGEGFMSENQIDLDFIVQLAENNGFAYRQIPHFETEKSDAFYESVVEACFEEIGNIARENQIFPIYVYWPKTQNEVSTEMVDLLCNLAKRQGFAIIDLRDVYKGTKKENLMVTSFDGHPSILGHQLVADQVFDFLKNDEAFLEFLNQKTR
ncbi:MAG: SGNH/GDSL hydrolase family protein, partial [Saprospiraceae bacterium]|nr:SGNH/GDSL hydrolase family protein [Saprospiraceae bacterium]